jgi:hypothetical protein
MAGARPDEWRRILGLKRHSLKVADDRPPLTDTSRIFGCLYIPVEKALNNRPGPIVQGKHCVRAVNDCARKFEQLAVSRHLRYRSFGS